ncbi:MAG: hypothetical protein ACXWUG_08525 [Polyangiales bacterium]
MRASFLVSSLVVAALATGCGGSHSASIFDEQVDGATSSDTGGAPGEDSSTTSDSSGPTDDSSTVVTDSGTATDTSKPDAPDTITLDNVCDRLASAVCTKKLASCCGSKGVTYDEGNCRDAITTSCGDQVDAVKAGDGTFDATAFAACAAAWSTLEGKCSVPILDYVKTYPPCQQLLNGTVAPNDGCTKDSDCHAAPGQWVRCATDGSARCNAFTIPGSGKPCGYGTGTAAICDYGLACNYTSMTMGTCKSAKGVGATCTQDTECGFGNYCAKSPFGGMSGTCATGLPYMTACSTSASCASGRCSSGSCTNPNFELAIPALCGG